MALVKPLTLLALLALTVCSVRAAALANTDLFKYYQQMEGKNADDSNKRNRMVMLKREPMVMLRRNAPSPYIMLKRQPMVMLKRYLPLSTIYDDLIEAHSDPHGELQQMENLQRVG